MRARLRILICVGLLLLVAVVSSVSVQAGPPEQGPSPQIAFDELNARANGALQVRWDQQTGIPRFLSGPIFEPAAGAGGLSIENAAMAFFEMHAALYGMADPNSELLLVRKGQSEGGWEHLRFQQVYQGVEVWGAELDVHLQNGQIFSIGSHYKPGLELDVTPGLSRDEAIAIVQADLGAQEPKLVNEATRLVIFQIDGQPHLTWRVKIFAWDPLGNWSYYVDAKTGEIRYKLNELPDARSRFTYTANNGWFYPGTLARSEGQGPVGDTDVNSAHNYAGQVYDYYWNTFGRDSWDDSGANMVSTVHFGVEYNNAFWTGYPDNQMVYGDGDGVVFGPLARALDVVAHELTHAVTENEANLVYEYQPGALNESYSDFFGAMVDRDDWLMGEVAYTPSVPGDALRDMQDPVLYGQPGDMIEYVDLVGYIDNGGVHINSGIPNRAGYCVATGIGYEKAEQIYYDTLSNWLLSTDDLMDARDKTIASCASLYGSGGNTCRVVQNCFAGVGLGPATSLVGLTHKMHFPLVVSQYTPGQTCSQMTWIKNGGFENGDRYWPSGGVWITSGQVPKHSGGWSAWFGGYDNAYDVALQAPRVPANATTITWSAWVYMTSAEGTGTVYDTLDLLIQDDYTSTLDIHRVADNSSLYPRGTWFKRSISWSSPSWRGKRIRFEILGQGDELLDTNFFVDDVSLVISCSGGTPQVQSDVPVADEIVVEGEPNPNAPVLAREP